MSEQKKVDLRELGQLLAKEKIKKKEKKIESENEEGNDKKSSDLI
ncbi:MAG: hypothetical protein ACFFD1_16550 [Candidatus Thorarchaeota archaeon]